MITSSAPSTTQMTERAVKHGNQCRGPKRDEMYRSEFAITRSTIIRHASSYAKTLHESRTRTSRTSSLTVKDAMRTKTSGKCYLSYANSGKDGQFCSNVQEKFVDLLKYEENNSFVESRNEPVLEAFRESVATSNIDNIPLNYNFVPDYTPLMKGEVLYSILRKNIHLSHIIVELQARGVLIPNGSENKIRDLIKLLKIDEGNDKSFKPITNSEAFDIS